ncbi:hypothetical protein [Actinomadura opuntiae]|uniref:hypothetical protein n=1 Tax=Actinomadura sp. OS1-43 TaxID=604315 RepID=UPI00255AD25A|nr:hypothetical protein [Actinomadura sp. OS1-43]MDL4815468.1 hypothetical protein [Actinomadura sp. OS1-43]
MDTDQAAPATPPSAEQMGQILLAGLRQDFPGWTFTFAPRNPHPWVAKRKLPVKDLGGAWAIRAKDGEILRELVDAAISSDAKLNRVRP